MKKGVSILLILLFTFVSAAAWDCGCAFAEQQEAVYSRTVEESHPCHEVETQSSRSHEDCCPKCQIEEQGRIPQKVGVISLNSFSDKFSNQDNLNSLNFISPFSAPSLYGCKRQQIGSLCVSVSKVPTYLFTQSLLI